MECENVEGIPKVAPARWPLQNHPYFLTARSIAGPAFIRSSGTMAGWNLTWALNARNLGSAIAEIWTGHRDVSYLLLRRYVL